MSALRLFILHYKGYCLRFCILYKIDPGFEFSWDLYVSNLTPPPCVNLSWLYIDVLGRLTDDSKLAVGMHMSVNSYLSLCVGTMMFWPPVQVYTTSHPKSTVIGSWKSAAYCNWQLDVGVGGGVETAITDMVHWHVGGRDGKLNRLTVCEGVFGFLLVILTLHLFFRDSGKGGAQQTPAGW